MKILENSHSVQFWFSFDDEVYYFCRWKNILRFSFSTITRRRLLMNVEKCKAPVPFWISAIFIIKSKLHHICVISHPISIILHFDATFLRSIEKAINSTIWQKSCRCEVQEPKKKCEKIQKGVDSTLFHFFSYWKLKNVNSHKI